jgi:transcriptional regulator with XRE-family HTH domain
MSIELKTMSDGIDYSITVIELSIAKAGFSSNDVLDYNGAMDFKVWLAQELDRRGWSHAEMGRRAGVAQTTISNVISGNRAPGPDLCRAIAAVLSEPEEKVFRLAGLLSPLPISDDTTLTEIQEVVKNLPPEQQKQVLVYARFLRENRQEK